MKQDQKVPQQRKTWVPIKIEEVGKLTDTILAGGGKCSLLGGDPGDGRKQMGSDPGC
jgi:hypothetical protein